LLRVLAPKEEYPQIRVLLDARLRDSDYFGTMEDGVLHVLLSNTNREGSAYVMQRLAEYEIKSEIVEGML